MKYYYNGHLVRTSDHTYTHAVIIAASGKVIACRNGLENAEAAKRAELSSHFGKRIKYYEQMLEAARKGKTYFYDTTVMRGRSYKADVTHSAAELEIEIAELKELMANYDRYEWKVVPLEVR